ncbi:hypothetical protein SAMN05192566_0716 [Methylophilus rhizosphaerae]|uniref:Uncharacterized protein n=1 Tax=Methylophilus rhizosphaerae TaxID=492660 RepID=A0A1G9A6S6_9PROT|nr:hypothetical protein [Methylophilus rhizosphaerae]SDK22931.1 hypothetical protein SAMN05192566_0716 [Methylophilus rhizosphaerae]
MNDLKFYEEQFRTKLNMFTIRQPMFRNLDKEDYSIMMKLLRKLTSEFQLSEESLSLISQFKMLDNMKNPQHEGSGVTEFLAWMTINYIFVELKGFQKQA